MVFSPDLGGKNGGVLSMRMQVILDSPFARPGSAPIWGGKKGEFRDWTKISFKKMVSFCGDKLFVMAVKVDCIAPLCQNLMIISGHIR